MSFQQFEREKLAQLLLELGPDAPTLCEGWTTRDLITHMYIRENQPHRAVGYLVPALKSVTSSAEEAVKKRDYEDVVRAWAAGPPVFVKPLDPLINVSENFIHHEDVRRGGDRPVEPREFSAAVQEKLMSAAAMMGRLALSSGDVPVILTPPNLPSVTLGGKRGVAEQGSRVVRVKGDPGELLLWVTGRDKVEVEITGEPEDIAAVKRRI